MSCCDRFVMTESQDEFKMWQGLVGAHYTPYVDNDGNLSWTNNGGLPNPATVNIKGIPGNGLEIKGIVETVGDLPASASSGDVYMVGDEAPYDGYVFIDGGGWTYIGVVGIGENGRGIASIAKTGTSGLVDTYTITYTDGVNPTTFTVTNGADGQDGAPGTPGVGVPTGGTTGQVLAKASGTNYDTEWIDVEAGGGTVQSVNEVLPDQNGNITLTADDIETDNNQSIQDDLDDLSDAIGNVVHVGTSAPSDPSVKIWLDTDEPGMSGVSSVNGATGTVVLDADDVGAMSIDLLWENASLTSNFAAQTIPLDLSNYSSVLIKTVSNSTNSSYYYVVGNFCFVNSTCQIFSYARYNNAISIYSREITVNSNNIVFAIGYANGSDARENYAVPLAIYGIKGVTA